MKKNLRNFLYIIFIINLTACASLVDSATTRLTNNLQSAIANHDDPETIESALPGYMLLIDSLVVGEPENPNTLMAAANLYGTFNGGFNTDEPRAKRLAKRSFEYASKAICIEIPDFCTIRKLKLLAIKGILETIELDQLSKLYDFGSSWAGYIQTHTDDWSALADLPRLTAVFETCVELDETHDNGGAHLYLAVLASQLPPSLGGKPEIGLAHFDRARVLSNSKNLMIDVLEAKFYARLIFDQELHDELLDKVIDDQTVHQDLVLINALARQQAILLRSESEEFF
ncbi:MAG: hypothetical protein ACI845_003540 [Gammaproteobacteria bacterium]|jgi:hypothetical protein